MQKAKKKGERKHPARSDTLEEKEEFKENTESRHCKVCAKTCSKDRDKDVCGDTVTTF